MKRISLILLAGVAPLGLAACSSESEEPVEQIIVRQPGEAAPVLSGVANSLGTADIVAAGKAAFAACAACHSIQQDGASGAGPNLYGVAGRAAGRLKGFAYSEAMVSSGITWDSAALDAYLAAPSEVVPGTSMSAGAVTDPERRKAIIAYLASLSQ